MAKPTTRRHQTPTLTAYLARRFALYLMATLAALGAFAYLLDVVDLLAKAGGLGIPTPTLLTMSAFKLPDLLQQLLPFAVLLATLVTLTQLNRSSELVALRASGLPARRIMVGPLLVVILTGAFALTLLNPTAATLLKRYEVWSSQTFPGRAKGLVTQGGSIWLKQQITLTSSTTPSTLFIYGQKVGNEGTTIHTASLFVLTPQGTLTHRLETPLLTLTPGQWTLTSPTTITPSNKQLPPTATIPTSLTPTLLQNSFTQASTLSVWELQGFIANLNATGFPSQIHTTTYHRLIALPAFLIAMFLLGVPFAVRFQRNASLAGVVGLGLGLGMGFYLFSNFTATLGMAGRLSPILAAWAPTGIATLLALALLVYLREE
ncbi:MAG: LptF/LptG family permease [Alphaproteobacteria bacterium]